MKHETVALLKRVTTLSFVSLAGVIGSVFWHAYPSTEAVRLRNSLLIDTPAVTFFDWTPQDVPASFKLERLPIPEPMLSAARMVAAKTNGTDLDVARALTAHLMIHATKGGRIDSFDVSETYRTILASGAGYCSDIIDSYIALAQAAGLFVRPWAFSFDGFGGRGHIVVEIFDRQRDRWVMLDVFNNVQPLDRKTGTPVSVSEFREAFAKSKENIIFSQIGSGRQEFKTYKKLEDYYFSGINQWYFWNGNNVISRADSQVVQLAENIREELAELASISVDRFPGIIPLRTSKNRNSLRQMEEIKRFLFISLMVSCFLFIIGAVSTFLLIMNLLASFAKKS